MPESKEKGESLKVPKLESADKIKDMAIEEIVNAIRDQNRPYLMANVLMERLYDHPNPSEIWLDTLWSHAFGVMSSDPEPMVRVTRFARNTRDETVRTWLRKKLESVSKEDTPKLRDWAERELKGLK